MENEEKSSSGAFIQNMNKEKDLADFKRLISTLEAEGREFSKEDDDLMGIVSPEKFPYKTRNIVQEVVDIIDDNPEFVEMIPKHLRKFFSGYTFFKGESMSRAKKLTELIMGKDRVSGKTDTGQVVVIQYKSSGMTAYLIDPDTDQTDAATNVDTMSQVWSWLKEHGVSEVNWDKGGSGRIE